MTYHGNRSSGPWKRGVIGAGPNFEECFALGLKNGTKKIDKFLKNKNKMQKDQNPLEKMRV